MPVKTKLKSLRSTIICWTTWFADIWLPDSITSKMLRKVCRSILFGNMKLPLNTRQFNALRSYMKEICTCIWVRIIWAELLFIIGRLKSNLAKSKMFKNTMTITHTLLKSTWKVRWGGMPTKWLLSEIYKIYQAII
jgi:hypothetical protein